MFLLIFVASIPSVNEWFLPHCVHINRRTYNISPTIVVCMRKKVSITVGTVLLITCFSLAILVSPVSSDDINELEYAENTDKSVSLDIQPVEDGKTSVGTTEKYEVVVRNATEGVAVYDTEIRLGKVTGAKIVDFSEEATEEDGSSIFTRSKILNAGGSPDSEGVRLNLEAALNTKTFDPSEEIVIATLDVRLDSSDSVSINWKGFGNTIGYMNDSSTVLKYETESTNGSEISKIDLPEVDVTGDGNPATDTNGDGLLNDVNGDGQFNIFDVQAMYENFNEPVVQNHTQFFDFNGDNVVNIFDVQNLFERV